MRTLYGVHAGEYSDERILGLFEDRDEAARVVAECMAIRQRMDEDWDVVEFRYVGYDPRIVEHILSVDAAEWFETRMKEEIR